MPAPDDTLDRTASGRRLADRLAGPERSLDWSSRPSDVLLFPHSPLALIDVLEHPEGAFDLLPFEAAADACLTGASSAGVHALTAGGSRGGRDRAVRSRMNLLTRHAKDELRNRCRGAIVDAALVRSADDRRTYFAAGFLVAPRAEVPLRAPVMMYPALLVTDADGFGQQVRIDGAMADSNRRLIEHARDAFGVALPERNEGEPLADFFARLAGTVASLPEVELEFDVALGNASTDFLGDAGRGRTTLPAMPPRFDAALALELASGSSLEELHAVLHLMPDGGAPGAVGDATALDARDDDTSPARSTAHSPAERENLEAAANALRPGPSDDVGTLRAYATELAAHGLDHVGFGELPALADRLEAQLAALDASLASHTVSGVFGAHAFKVGELVRLGGIIELIDKAPESLEQHRHADLGFAATGTLLRRARHQAQLIEEELDALQAWFLLDRVPPKPQLLQLIEEISGAIRHGPEVIGADYFHARRQFIEFSVEKPAQLTDEHRRKLAQLAKVLRFRELFVNNTEYRRALGAGYRGLRTDWDALERVVDYARELGGALRSEELGSIAMRDFDAFRRALIEDLGKLRAGGDALLGALPVLGAQWRSCDVGEFERHARGIVAHLRRWRREYGEMSGHETRTPAGVLAQFSGQTGRDGATERRVRDARERIAAGLRSGELEPLAIAATLDWLRAASLCATTRGLDIGILVERLQDERLRSSAR